MIDIERLLRVPFVDTEGSFDISPDGTQLAFSWNITGRWEIYELDLNAPDEARLVSVGRGAKSSPSYSPDGSRLAYAVDFDGGENFHIFVQERPAGLRSSGKSISASASGTFESSDALLKDDKTGQPRDLTPNVDFAIQRNFSWSPDGTQIAFLTNKSGCFSTYIMDAGGGDARLLLDNGFPAWDVSWSPDGRHLAVMSIALGQDFFIFVIPLDGSKPFSIGDEHGPINAHNPAWSPDGTKLAFHSDVPNGFHQIGMFDVSTRQISWLTDGQANCRLPAWSKDGAQLAYIRAQGACDKVVIHPHAAEARTFQVESGVHYKPHFTADGQRVYLIFNNPRHPPDIWMFLSESGEFCQLTYSIRSNDFAEHPVRINRVGATEVAITEFVMPEEITYPGMDGAPIPALLFKYENADLSTPAVVVIHGGPGWHFQVEWYPYMIHLASRGWTVLAPNYRGSTGYGRSWQLANRLDLGGVDTDDVAAGVRYLLDNGLADPKRISVTGRSHGGYLTMSCLTRYPDLWCAGSAVVPFVNWFSAHENSREDLQHWDLQNFGNPTDNYDLWYERSPFFFLEKIKAPVQLICGENDPRCPASESLLARDKLLELGKVVDFHLYLGEGHAFLKTENVVDSEVQRVNFLAKALS